MPCSSSAIQTLRILPLATCLVMTLPAADEPALEAPEATTSAEAAPAESPASVTDSVRLAGETTDERGAALVRYVASVRPLAKDELYAKAAAPCYAAKLMLGVDAEYARSRLEACARHLIDAQKPGADGRRGILDPFDKVALVNTYFLNRDKVTPATALLIRDYVALWEHRELKGYAKNAWNYHLMMDGAGYLAAEEWPDLVDVQGLDAAAIRQATRNRLMRDYEDIARRNYMEYGATIYGGVNLSAVRLVAEFAKDKELANRATMALDAMLLDIACTWNQGYNAGTASRAKYWASTDTGPDAMASTAAAAWVSFGSSRPILGRGTGWIHSFWMATPGAYRVPSAIVAVAQDRAKPVLHRSTIPASGKVSIHRTTYHSPSFSLCSQWEQGGTPSNGLYKESRRHMLKWISDKPSSTFCVCMENPRRPYNLAENKANALGYGENPFSQYLQNEGTILGLYVVPNDYPYYKLYAPFPTSGSIHKRIEQDGWILCHNGGMLMGLRLVKPGGWADKPWSGNDLLWCKERRNGWVLETSELAPFAGGGEDAELSRFAAALKQKTDLALTGQDTPTPCLRYTSLSGQVLALTWQPHGKPYTGQHMVDGKPVDYASWPMVKNPWVSQTEDVPNVVITQGKQTLTLDFATWTRREGSIP